MDDLESPPGRKECDKGSNAKTKKLLDAFVGIPRALLTANVDDLSDVVRVVGANVGNS